MLGDGWPRGADPILGNIYSRRRSETLSSSRRGLDLDINLSESGRNTSVLQRTKDLAFLRRTTSYAQGLGSGLFGDFSHSCGFPSSTRSSRDFLLTLRFQARGIVRTASRCNVLARLVSHGHATLGDDLSKQLRAHPFPPPQRRHRNLCRPAFALSAGNRSIATLRSIPPNTRASDDSPPGTTSGTGHV